MPRLTRRQVDLSAGARRPALRDEDAQPRSGARRLKRAGVRLGALDVLYEGESWADVVRESRGIVELALEALLRASGVDVPRVDDVSPP